MHNSDRYGKAPAIGVSATEKGHAQSIDPDEPCETLEIDGIQSCSFKATKAAM
jgi:hypothetical protein